MLNYQERFFQVPENLKRNTCPSCSSTIVNTHTTGKVTAAAHSDKRHISALQERVYQCRLQVRSSAKMDATYVENMLNDVEWKAYRQVDEITHLCTPMVSFSEHVQVDVVAHLCFPLELDSEVDYIYFACKHVHNALAASAALGNPFAIVLFETVVRHYCPQLVERIIQERNKVPVEALGPYEQLLFYMRTGYRASACSVVFHVINSGTEVSPWFFIMALLLPLEPSAVVSVVTHSDSEEITAPTTETPPLASVVMDMCEERFDEMTMYQKQVFAHLVRSRCVKNDEVRAFVEKHSIPWQDMPMSELIQSLDDSPDVKTLYHVLHRTTDWSTCLELCERYQKIVLDNFYLTHKYGELLYASETSVLKQKGRDYIILSGDSRPLDQCEPDCDVRAECDANMKKYASSLQELYEAVSKLRKTHQNIHK